MVGGCTLYGWWLHVLWWLEARFMVGGRTFYGGWTNVLWWVDSHFMVGGRTFYGGWTLVLWWVDARFMVGGRTFHGGRMHFLWWVDARFMVGGRTFYGGWTHVFTAETLTYLMDYLLQEPRYSHLKFVRRITLIFNKKFSFDSLYISDDVDLCKVLNIFVQESGGNFLESFWGSFWGVILEVNF